MIIDRAGREIINFLDRHRLPHTPTNYAFGWRFFQADNAPFQAEVRAIVDDGVRVTQENVDRFMAAPQSDIVKMETVSLETIASDIIAIIGDATRAAGTFSRDLTLAAADLVATDGGRVHAVVSTMISEAERAEARLAEMSRQTSTVRAKLMALGRKSDADPEAPLHDQNFTQAALVNALGTVDRVVLAIICVDQSTKIGASFGIGVTERVLRAAGQTLAEHCTPHTVGRWRAKSLAVIFLGIEVELACSKIQTARQAFAKRALILRESDEPLGTVTFSAVIADMQLTNGGDLEEVLGLLAAAAAELRDEVAVLRPDRTKT